MTMNHKKYANDDQVIIDNFFARIPDDVAASFDEKQIACIKAAFDLKTRGNHQIDVRGTFRIPFVRTRYYYVILLGRNRRRLTRYEHEISRFLKTTIVLILLLLSTAMGLLVLYLVKSAMGIDIFKEFSLGIWDYFKNHFL